MTYVIYNVETTRLLNKNMYATPAAAKAAMTRAAKADCTMIKSDYGFADAGDFYTSIEKMVERKNLRSGEMYKEPINTPGYCSPSCESYWSM
jgi:hypothetical protein